MKKILDLGCGQGHGTYVLSKNNKVIGIDIAKDDIVIAKSRYPKVDYRIMSAEKLKFRDKFFDEIYCMDVFEHLDNLPPVINQIKRVLKKNGILKINIPYWKSEKWLLKLRPSYFKEIHHVRIFKETELEDTLSTYGFEMIEKKRINFLTHIEHYFMFKRKKTKKSQLGIGNWRDNWFTFSLHLTLLYFSKSVLDTPLKYFPIWIITIPIGEVINYFGNKTFPKTVNYVFTNTRS